MKNQGPREATYPTQVIPVVSYRFGLQCRQGNAEPIWGSHSSTLPASLPHCNGKAGTMGTSSQEVVFLPTL